MRREAIRWVLTPFVITLLIFFAFYLTRYWAYNGLLRRWIEPVAFFQGTLFSFLAMAALVPRFKILSVMVWFAISFYVGWEMSSWFDPITQEPTILSFSSGVAGSVPGIVLAIVLALRQRRHQRREPGNKARVSRSAKNQRAQVS